MQCTEQKETLFQLQKIGTAILPLEAVFAREEFLPAESKRETSNVPAQPARRHSCLCFTGHIGYLSKINAIVGSTTPFRRSQCRMKSND